MNCSLNESGVCSDNINSSNVELWNQFLVICGLSAVYLSLLSILTTLAKGLLLVALYQDPFKTFRQPPTILITGLALADFLTSPQTTCHGKESCHLCVWYLDIFSNILCLSTHGRPRKGISKNRRISQPFANTRSHFLGLHCATYIIQASGCAINALYWKHKQ